MLRGLRSRSNQEITTNPHELLLRPWNGVERVDEPSSRQGIEDFEESKIQV
jgi:hypothetical protein